ncbi:MAG: sigma-70 family RNA polymerase sigma factor [Clostridia bacterium]|nr:sigma-70 family RNA polymerase sigma factor [Clostridia bacterium]
MKKPQNNENIAKLIDKLEPLIKSTAKRYTRPGYDYQELCQECRLAIMEALDQYDADRGVPLLYYLKKMINYHLLNYCRKDRYIQSLDQPVFDEGAADYYEILEDKKSETFHQTDTSLWVEQMLQTLTPKQREIIIEHFFRDKKLKDIAMQQGVHYQTVVKLKDRALKRLRENID